MDATTVDPQAYRTAIGQFATGVCVVTCHAADGPTGLTTNAVSSLSLDPLLLLVCFDNDSRTLPAVREAGRFAVNVLAEGQERLATVFASKSDAKFDGVTHEIAHGVPVLDGALAYLACDLKELLPGGDHTIGIGAVTQTSVTPNTAPLVFFDGDYRTLHT